MNKIRVLDALSVIVLIEQCDPDWTIVTFWHTRYYGARSSSENYSPVEYHAAPVKATMCLRCVLNTVGVVRSSDGRADLLRMVKAGEIQICAIGERDDVTRCGKCQQLPPSKTISTTR